MAISKKISWIEGERLLRSAGKRSEAIALLRQEISKNNRLAAKIVLATMYGADAGLSDTEIDRIIDDAEREVKDSDVDAQDRKSTPLNSSHIPLSRMPSSA